MVAHSNGGWPELDPHTPPGDGDLPSAWMRLCEALEFIKGVFMGAQGEARIAARDAKRASMDAAIAVEYLKTVIVDVNAIKVALRVTPSLPPMRPESDSSHAFAKKASDSFGERLGEKLVAMAAETPGPKVNATPEQIQKLAVEFFADEARKVKADADAKQLASIEAARLQRVADIHALKMHGAKIMVAVAVLSIIATGAAYWKGTHDRPTPVLVLPQP